MGYAPPTIEEAMILEKTVLWYKRSRTRFAIVVGGGILLSLVLLMLVLYLKAVVSQRLELKEELSSQTVPSIQQ